MIKLSQQDYTRSHLARVTVDLLDQHHITRLPWSLRSPDLSPVMFGRRLLNLEHPFQTMAILRERWGGMDQNNI